MPENGHNGFSVTPASQWRRDYMEGKLVEMPSGRVVRLRSISVNSIVSSGKLSEQLSAIALQGLGVTDEKGKKKPISEVEIVKRYDELLEVFCRDTWVSPRIVDSPDPDKDEIEWAWVYEEEKQFTFGLMNTPVREWERFLPQSGTGVESVQPGESDTSSTE